MAVCHRIAAEKLDKKEWELDDGLREFLTDVRDLCRQGTQRELSDEEVIALAIKVYQDAQQTAVEQVERRMKKRWKKFDEKVKRVVERMEKNQ